MSETKYHVRVGDDVRGPLTASELIQLARNGDISEESLCCLHSYRFGPARREDLQYWNPLRYWLPEVLRKPSKRTKRKQAEVAPASTCLPSDDLPPVPAKANSQIKAEQDAMISEIGLARLRQADEKVTWHLMKGGTLLSEPGRRLVRELVYAASLESVVAHAIAASNLSLEQLVDIYCQLHDQSGDRLMASYKGPFLSPTLMFVWPALLGEVLDHSKTKLQEAPGVIRSDAWETLKRVCGLKCCFMLGEDADRCQRIIKLRRRGKENTASPQVANPRLETTIRAGTQQPEPASAPTPTADEPDETLSLGQESLRKIQDDDYWICCHLMHGGQIADTEGQRRVRQLIETVCLMPQLAKLVADSGATQDYIAQLYTQVLRNCHSYYIADYFGPLLSATLIFVWPNVLRQALKDEMTRSGKLRGAADPSVVRACWDRIWNRGNPLNAFALPGDPHKVRQYRICHPQERTEATLNPKAESTASSESNRTQSMPPRIPPAQDSQRQSEILGSESNMVSSPTSPTPVWADADPALQRVFESVMQKAVELAAPDATLQRGATDSGMRELELWTWCLCFEAREKLLAAAASAQERGIMSTFRIARFLRVRDCLAKAAVKIFSVCTTKGTSPGIQMACLDKILIRHLVIENNCTDRHSQGLIRAMSEFAMSTPERRLAASRHGLLLNDLIYVYGTALHAMMPEPLVYMAAPILAPTVMFLDGDKWEMICELLRLDAEMYSDEASALETIRVNATRIAQSIVDASSLMHGKTFLPSRSAIQSQIWP